MSVQVRERDRTEAAALERPDQSDADMEVEI